MKRKLALLLSVLLLLSLFSACTGEKEAEGKASPELLGHWYQKEGRAELDFSDDGTFKGMGTEETGIEGLDLADRYQAGEKQIIFSDTADNRASVDYSISGGELTLSALGRSCVFVRVAPLTPEGGQSTEATGEASTEPETDTPATDDTETGDDTQPQSEAPTQPPASSLAETIVGTWSTTYNGATLTYTFNADGTGSAGTMGFTFPIDYNTDNDVLTVTGYGFGTSDTGSATFEIKDNTLYATKDGETLAFTKVS